MPSVCSLILIPKMGITETTQQLSLKGGGWEIKVTCTVQNYLLTTTLAQYKVEHLLQEPFSACVDLEKKITSHQLHLFEISSIVTVTM